MKSFRVMGLVIVLGAFLCVNGLTCLPCFLTLIYHQLVCEHTYGPVHECHADCPLVHLHEEEADHEHENEHEHHCPDLSNHARLVPISPVVANSIEYSSKTLEAQSPPGHVVPVDRLFNNVIKLRRWLILCEAFPEQPLYIQNAQLLL